MKNSEKIRQNGNTLWNDLDSIPVNRVVSFVIDSLSFICEELENISKGISYMTKLIEGNKNGEDNNGG